MAPLRSVTPRVVVALVAAILLGGCGTATQVSGSDEPASADADRRAGAVQAAEPAPGPFGLSCPSGELSSTDGGFYARLPDGLPTREQAVEAWLSRSELSGYGYDTETSASHAWVLRPDGTRVARLRYLVHSGYTVHGVESCVD